MSPTVTASNIANILANDDKVKLAGIDCDGVLRGKVMDKDKFLSIVSSGFGFSSAIFGWDMHDLLYTTNAKITSSDIGYPDFTATPDLNTFRRIPWENNIPFFLLRFTTNGARVSADGRGMLKAQCDKLADQGCTALAGVELEFINFKTPSSDGYKDVATHGLGDMASYLETNSPKSLRTITSGMFGYSATRPVHYKDYFYEIFDKSREFGCDIEGWHTESGPGFYEAALKVCDVRQMADRTTLFKFVAKSVALQYQITPCFMAKPIHGMSGSSGHLHISLCDKLGKNLFTRSSYDEKAGWADIAWLSDLGRHFLAGILDVLPDVMPMFAPNVNSYKRLVENYWAPVYLNWGLEDRFSSVRLIAPPTCKASATRFEVRIPGADLHPHYAMTTLFAAGWRGVEKKLTLSVPPMSAMKAAGQAPELLPNTLEEALRRFEAPESLSREILDPDFVDFFCATRHHELKLYKEAVTDWEFKRYAEVV